jgi:hypothetical protein
MEGQQEKLEPAIETNVCQTHGGNVPNQFGCRYCKDPKAPKSLCREADQLIRQLWRFIDNVGDDDHNRSEKFFALRCRVREYYDHAG